MSDILKSVIQDLINDRKEQAQASIHQYIVSKTQEVAGLNEAKTTLPALTVEDLASFEEELKTIDDELYTDLVSAYEEFKPAEKLDLHSLHASPEALTDRKPEGPPPLKFPLRIQSGCEYMGVQGTITITLKKNGDIKVTIRARGRSDSFDFDINDSWGEDVVSEAESTLYA